MSKAEKRESAFPVTWKEDSGASLTEQGLTKQEYFAGLFMQGMIMHGWTDYIAAAKESVEASNALLKQLAP